MIQRSSDCTDRVEGLALEALADLVPAPGDTGLGTPMPAKGRLDMVPRHGLQPPPPRDGLVAAAGLVLAALVLHAGFALLFIHLLDWRVVDTSMERNIPVEVVTAVPGEIGSPDAPSPPNGSTPAGREASKPSEPQPAAKPQAPGSQPPPFVAPPPEPARAQSRTDQPKPPVTAADTPKPAPPQPAPPALPAPKALTSSGGPFAVATPEKSKPNPAPEPKPSVTAPTPQKPVDLSAALPMDFAGLPSSFRAVLSAAGNQASEEYKGLVFGQLGRSQDAVERARQQGLRGIVIVSFKLDDEGGISEIRIARSSGIAALDAIAVDMVKGAAPFPPPPPDGPRTFTPALSFGDT